MKYENFAKRKFPSLNLLMFIAGICLCLGCAPKQEYLTETHPDYQTESARHQSNLLALEKSNQRLDSLRAALKPVEALLDKQPNDFAGQENYHLLTGELEKEEDNQRYLQREIKKYHESSIFNDQPQKIRELEERKRREGE